MTRAWSLLPVATLVGMATVAGCGGESTQSAVTLLPPEQVTFANYQAGVLAFADCLIAAGHPLLQLRQRDDDPRLYFYEITLEGDATSCYDDHLAVIDEAWQIKLEQERRADPESDPEYQQFLECSRRLGRPVSSQESLRTILDDFANNDIDPVVCVEGRGTVTDP